MKYFKISRMWLFFLIGATKLSICNAEEIKTTSDLEISYNLNPHSYDINHLLLYDKKTLEEQHREFLESFRIYIPNGTAMYVDSGLIHIITDDMIITTTYLDSDEKGIYYLRPPFSETFLSELEETDWTQDE